MPPYTLLSCRSFLKCSDAYQALKLVNILTDFHLLFSGRPCISSGLHIEIEAQCASIRRELLLQSKLTSSLNAVYVGNERSVSCAGVSVDVIS